MKLGLITALTVEAEDYISTFNLKLLNEICGIKIYNGQYHQYEIYLIICSCGKVNAVYATKHLIDLVHPDIILHSGIAGGIGKTIHPLDLVLADHVTYHDVSVRQMQELPPYLKEFKCDKNLNNEILKHAEVMEINIKIGHIITGDSFIADSKVAKQLAETYQAEMVDMESAAVGQVCNMENIPLAILRCASDEASDEADDVYSENEQTASTKAAECFISLIEQDKI